MSTPTAFQRWSVLFAVGGLMWGIYFVYDLPASLSTPLQKHLQQSPQSYAYFISLFYTVYSLPNIVLPFLGGIALEKYGMKWTLAITFGLFLIGQTIFAGGVHIRDTTMLVLGRSLMGMGGEIVGVIATSIVTNWFNAHELSLSLALLLCLSRLGSVANSIIVPRLLHIYTVPTVTWLATLSLVLSTICVILLYTYFIPPEQPKAQKQNHSLLSFYTNAIAPLPAAYWTLVIICMTVYGCVGPFNNSAQRYLTSTFDYIPATAGFYASLPDLLSALLTPIFGLLSTHYPLSLLISSSLILTSHLLLLFRILAPIPLTILGIGYSLYGVSLWPALACAILKTSGPQMPVPILQNILPVPTEDHTLRKSISWWGQSLLEEYAAVPSPTPSQPLLHAQSRTQTPIEVDDEDNIRNMRTPLHSRQVSGTWPSSYTPLDGDTQEWNSNDTLVIGYGLVTSLLNLSLTLVPTILAAVESLDGFRGMELVFVILAGIGVFASVHLAKQWVTIT